MKWESEIQRKKNNGDTDKQKTRDKMTIVSPHMSIITLNVNGMNSPIKRHRVARWIKKKGPTICCLQETHLSSKDKQRLKVKGWKVILQENGNIKSSYINNHPKCKWIEFTSQKTQSG